MADYPIVDGNQFILRLQERTDAGNYGPSEEWFEQALGIKVQTTYLSSLGKQYTARVGQALVQRPDGLLLLSPESFELTTRDGSSYVDKLASVVEWAPRLQVVVACVGSKENWRVEYVIGPADSEVFARCCATFPHASHRPVDVPPLPRARVEQPKSVPPPSGLDIDALARELLIEPADWLHDVMASVLRRDREGNPRPRSIVFYGPPGTGKTFLARRLARYLAMRAEMSGFVQLHPSYGYEDFFEGYRPAVATEGLALEKRAGPLRRIADHARMAPGELAVLVMDEANRGNLPRVFGELYFLLEYRDEAISLMYSADEKFSLPPNLLFIATMNTADRSVIALDQALRRRFEFVGMFPDRPPVAGMLRRYLAAHYPDGRLTWVADVVDRANERLDRNVQIGPSYFMRADLDEAAVRRIWRTSVLPSIEDQFLGRERELEELDMERLRGRAPSGNRT
ncbi:McrB family protein [Chondromyces crocatus]|uniref:McrB family protein n=1 Tax=Chondromyces crocatus TaxID=52 RepID=UPI0014707493|nr:AAA family ATPase [Chondromyces crocatus]